MVTIRTARFNTGTLPVAHLLYLHVQHYSYRKIFKINNCFFHVHYLFIAFRNSSTLFSVKYELNLYKQYFRSFILVFQEPVSKYQCVPLGVQ
jgi:hypothetical protein